MKKIEIPVSIANDPDLSKLYGDILKDLPSDRNFLVDDKKNISGLLTEDFITEWTNSLIKDNDVEKLIALYKENNKKEQASFLSAVCSISEAWKKQNTDFMTNYKVGQPIYGLWEVRWAYILSFLNNDDQEKWFSSPTSKADTLNDMTWRARKFDDDASEYFTNSAKNPKKRFMYVLKRLETLKDKLSKSSFIGYMEFYDKLEATPGWQNIFDVDVKRLLNICGMANDFSINTNDVYIFYYYMILDGDITKKEVDELMADTISCKDFIFKFILTKFKDKQDIKKYLGRVAYNHATRMACQINIGLASQNGQKVHFLCDNLKTPEGSLELYGGATRGDQARRGITLSELKYALSLSIKNDVPVVFYREGKIIKLDDLLKDEEIKNYVENIKSNPDLYKKFGPKPKF